MSRANQTIAPIAKVFEGRVPLTVHGAFYEFGCAGTLHKGTTPEQIAANLAHSHGLKDITFT